jgi:hypothetical protein
MYFLANKANRITFLATIMIAFIIMIIDGIKTITVPYGLFMSYFICGITLFHLMTYKILLKNN